jgi:hypothetical protein
MAMGLYRQHPTSSSAAQLDEISRVRNTAHNLLTARWDQTQDPNGNSLRAFSQALLVSPDDFRSETFPRWANEEGQETLFQKMDSQQVAVQNSWGEAVPS